MTRRYTLAQLEYVAAAVQHGSMSRAARELNVTQSAVSLAVAALERSFGFRLFRRTARGLVPTARTRELLGDLHRVLGAAAELDEVLSSDVGGVGGRLRLGCFTPLAPFILPQVLGRLVESHPELELDVSEGSLLAVQDALLEGRTEIALSYDHELVTGVETEPVFHGTSMHVLLPAHHHLARKETLEVSDLAQEPLIVMRVPPTQDFLRRQLSRLGLERQIRFSPATYDLAAGLVGQGLGCAVVGFATASEHTADGRRIVARRLSMPESAFTVVLAWPGGASLGRAALAFGAAAREVGERLARNSGQL